MFLNLNYFNSVQNLKFYTVLIHFIKLQNPQIHCVSCPDTISVDEKSPNLEWRNTCSNFSGLEKTEFEKRTKGGVNMRKSPPGTRESVLLRGIWAMEDISKFRVLSWHFEMNPVPRLFIFQTFKVILLFHIFSKNLVLFEYFRSWIRYEASTSELTGCHEYCGGFWR